MKILMCLYNFILLKLQKISSSFVFIQDKFSIVQQYIVISGLLVILMMRTNTLLFHTIGSFNAILCGYQNGQKLVMLEA